MNDSVNIRFENELRDDLLQPIGEQRVLIK